MNNEFYVYAYLDPRKPGCYIYGGLAFDFEPFYIGKGKRDRLNVHVRIATSPSTRRSEKNNKILKLLRMGLAPIIIKVKEGMSNEEAFKLEKYLIDTIGRSSTGTGVLTNVYEGGEGAGSMPEATKAKISKAKSGVKLSPEAVENIRKSLIGRKHSEKTRRRISESNMGKIMSEEARAKMSKARMGMVLSEEVRANISKGHIGIHAGEKNPNYGVVQSPKSKEKSSLSHAKYIYWLIDPAGNIYSTHSLPFFCKTIEGICPNGFLPAIVKGKFYKGWFGYREPIN